MINFNLNTSIYRPLQQVFAFVATPENDFHWQYGTLISAQISKGEIGMGTLFRTVSHFMGRRIETMYQVTEFESDKSYGFKSLSGPVDSHTLYTFEVTEGSTRINVSTQINPGDLFKSDNASAEKIVKKQYRENLALLKEVLEASKVDRPLKHTSLISNRRRSDVR